MNSINIVGRITKDPEVKTTTNGKEYCNFQLAVKRSYSKRGEQDVDFFNCIAWGGSALFLGNYIKKGQQLSISGSLQNNSYKDKKGNQVTVAIIQCREVQNLSPKGENLQQNNNNYNQQQGGYRQNSNNYNQPKQNAYNQQTKQGYSTAPNNQQQQRPQNNNQSFNVNVINDDLPF